MASVSKIVIIGNVGRDPELRMTPNGRPVCEFSVAVNRVTGKAEDRQEQTDWYRVSCWSTLAERAQQWGQKGRPAYIAGRFTPCTFCVDKVQKIDYKDVGRIRRFISDRGKIDPRRKSGTCAKHQRMLTTALKRARLMAMLPYTADHVRGLMSPQARAMAGGPPPPKPERPPYRPAGEFRPAGGPPRPPAPAPVSAPVPPQATPAAPPAEPTS